MQLKTKLAASVLSALFVISCNKKEIHYEDPLLTNRDTTIVPGDDFFHYANGGWFKKNPIPSSESSNGIFRTIGDTINAQIKSICEKSAANKDAVKGSNEQKIGDFYASGMDTISIEKNERAETVKDVTEVGNIGGLAVGLGDAAVKMLAKKLKQQWLQEIFYSR